MGQIMSEWVIETGTKTGTAWMAEGNGVDGRIAQANGRLKAGKIGVRIVRRGDTLSLRATLPLRSGALRRADGRSVLALGAPANPAGVQFAESKAWLLGAELQNGRFDWGNWTDQQQPGATVEDWLKRFAREYESTVEPISWQKDYLNAFRKLPGDVPLTGELLKQVLLQVKDASPTL
jgi:hypothetical protein